MRNVDLLVYIERVESEMQRRDYNKVNVDYFEEVRTN
jgi:hypothetical protein